MDNSNKLADTVSQIAKLIAYASVAVFLHITIGENFMLKIEHYFQPLQKPALYFEYLFFLFVLVGSMLAEVHGYCIDANHEKGKIIFQIIVVALCAVASYGMLVGMMEICEASPICKGGTQNSEKIVR